MAHRELNQFEELARYRSVGIYWRAAISGWFGKSGADLGIGAKGLDLENFGLNQCQGISYAVITGLALKIVVGGHLHLGPIKELEK